LFDEISLSAALQYIPTFDKIVIDTLFGEGKRRSMFADKALTFMVRGIRKKFKQPVAFVFTNSSMKTPNLVNAIKEVVEAVQLTGLKVIALICDQASTNVAAINILKAETNAKYLKEFHKEKRNLGFKLGGQEIVPLYDPPECVIGDRINPKLTDAHIYTDKMKKMEVSHAAQIFSQRVGSIMKMLATWSSI